jgi:hypothetical protein
MQLMHTQTATFKIRFKKRVVFKDQSGTVLRVFEVGDTFDATTATESYWVTSMGGIYFDEAEAA